MPEESVKEEARPKLQLQPIDGQPSGLTKKTNIFLKKYLPWIVVALSLLLIIAITGVIIWYNNQLTPVGKDTSVYKKITIKSGSTPSEIGIQLEKSSIIKSAFAFEIYARLSKVNNLLKAGIYRLSPSETTPQIVKHLTEGSSLDKVSITFYPGATLVDNTGSSKKYDVTTALKKAGYSDKEIEAALELKYDKYTNTLFAGKPASSDLEGYIYGDTYNFNTGVTVEAIFDRVFEAFYSVIIDNALIPKFNSQGLNLFQAITLASIVQREVSSSEDQKKVAQVFFTRMEMGMPLGSDPTYQYIADKTGVARDTNLDSPYNTRRYVGLPPGPISSPGLTALLAVAEPADTDYLYFVGGDDGVTRFAKTFAEHEANIANYCIVNCATP